MCVHLHLPHIRLYTILIPQTLYTIIGSSNLGKSGRYIRYAIYILYVMWTVDHVYDYELII